MTLPASGRLGRIGPRRIQTALFRARQSSFTSLPGLQPGLLVAIAHAREVEHQVVLDLYRLVFCKYHLLVPDEMLLVACACDAPKKVIIIWEQSLAHECCHLQIHVPSGLVVSE